MPDLLHQAATGMPHEALESDESEVELDADAEEEQQQAAEAAAATAASGSRRRSGKNVVSCTHPRGVKPLGNQLFDNRPSIRGPGFGWLGRAFTDASLLDLLRTHLDASDLLSLQRASRAMYILANEEEVWRERVLERWEGRFRFRADWKNTYASMSQRERWLMANPSATQRDSPDFPLLPPPLKFDGFYSDEIFQSFYCSHIDLLDCFDSSVEEDNIPRVHWRDMSDERFRAEFGVPNRPVIITGMMEEWPCFGKGEHTDSAWNQANWSRLYGEMEFAIGRYKMKLNDYFSYMNGISSDESPLYLFDSKFGDKAPPLLDQYTVPSFFARDLFNLLADGTPEGEKVRPSYRWILVGPARSGSTYHKDPNHTSAWNALISGEKKWIMYPPDQTPPGVFPTANAAEVVTPISVAEWFINNYSEHRSRIEEYERHVREVAEREAQQQKADAQPVAKKAKLSSSASQSTSSTPAARYIPGPCEATCHPGEIIFIPNGWVTGPRHTKHAAVPSPPLCMLILTLCMPCFPAS